MKKHLFIFTIAGLFFSYQREEADAPFATNTDISVLSSTETKASDNGLLGWWLSQGKPILIILVGKEASMALVLVQGGIILMFLMLWEIKNILTPISQEFLITISLRRK